MLEKSSEQNVREEVGGGGGEQREEEQCDVCVHPGMDTYEENAEREHRGLTDWKAKQTNSTVAVVEPRVVLELHTQLQQLTKGSREVTEEGFFILCIQVHVLLEMRIFQQP